jgi:hypothetical protein
MTSGEVLATKWEANPAEEWDVVLVAYLAAELANVLVTRLVGNLEQAWGFLLGNS